MALPTPTLDDRRFQDIVDEAKKLIPRFCPEWTDHNVSDPGIALIELFAWMTDMLLYRANRVPELVYIKFLEFLGAQLLPPQPARAPITFYLTAPAASETRIRRGTSLATTHADDGPPRVFTTEAELAVAPAGLVGALTRAGPRPRTWTTHDIQQLLAGTDVTRMFPPNAVPRDGFYLAFDRDRSAHVLHLNVRCRHAVPAGIDPDHPPIVWEALLDNAPGAGYWRACDVEQDGTGGFSRSGTITLHVPYEAPMLSRELEGIHGYWLRCRLTDDQRQRGYEDSPEIERLGVEAWGGTTTAVQSTPVENEVLGISEGTPRQKFRLKHAPVVRGEPHCLLVNAPGSRPTEEWREVDDFSASGPDDPHFTLDYVDGTVTFGPTLLLPDGRLRRFGQVPRRGARLTFSSYAWGGGANGNVPRGRIGLQHAIPRVQRATNRHAATGGADRETLEHAQLRMAELLRMRTRAVTASDFEWFATRIAGVARARCVAVGAQPAGAGATPPGDVRMCILPGPREAARTPVYVQPEDLALDSDLEALVEKELAAVSTLGIRRIEARPVQCTWVWVSAVLHLKPGSTAERVTAQAQAAVERYLSPYVGGPDQRGWPFGRVLRRADMYNLLQSVPGVAFVEDVALYTVDESRPDDDRALVPAEARGIAIRPDAVLCSSSRPHNLSAVAAEAD